MTLAADYERVRTTWSDIQDHLPTFVNLVLELDAQHVIELGTRWGTSTVAWLYALEQTGGLLTSIDVGARPQITGPVRADSWRFIQANDLDPPILAALEPADIVFIDTSHHYQHTLDELAAYLPKVKPGGRILLHDTELKRWSETPISDPDYPVKMAIEEFCAEHDLEWENNPASSGMGMIFITDSFAPPRLVRTAETMAASVRAQRESQYAEGMVKTADDLARYRVVLDRVRPDLIIECGTWTGHSAHWFAAEADCDVVTVDVNPITTWDDRVNQLVGSSADPAIVKKVAARARRAKRVMIVLDSWHSTDHVAAELAAYARMVTPGSYLVVEDGIVRWIPTEREYYASDGPLAAIEAFLATTEDFENDDELEGMLPTTQHPNGWLRRI